MTAGEQFKKIRAGFAELQPLERVEAKLDLLLDMIEEELGAADPAAPGVDLEGKAVPAPAGTSTTL